MSNWGVQVKRMASKTRRRSALDPKLQRTCVSTGNFALAAARARSGQYRPTRSQLWKVSARVQLSENELPSAPTTRNRDLGRLNSARTCARTLIGPRRP